SLTNPYFKPSQDKSKHPYTILIPPPNLTAKLHLPHPSHTTLQHIITTIKTIQPYYTLYLPSIHHPAIPTQSNVQAKLNQ
ncbi:class I tRNA ligase family protein, partial [Staphylococcus epidermidis]|uniref:class I tRNA ligase family protein n=1 Tax=Staphylococcus epidermidis TaxID=1282 RepID=UPI0011AA0A7D